MPNDPRFTKGALGAFTFAHLNTLFEFKGDLESSILSNSMGNRGVSNPFMVKVTGAGVANAEYTWIEQNWNGTAFVNTTGGRVSTTTNNIIDCPLISVSALTAGSIIAVCLSAQSSSSVTKPSLMVCGGASTTASVFSARITSATQVGTSPLKWSYGWTGVTMSGSTWTANSLVGSAALNGAEWQTTNDGPTVFGVGMELSTSTFATLTRKPIKVSTIVMMNESPTGQYWFSLPNGYKVVC
jgi:hypothetical protein